MKFINKNKTVILVVLIFLGMVVFVASIKNLLVPDEGKAAYGDRLDGIENHKLKDSLFEDITNKLKENSQVLEVTHQVHGKIINLIITVNDDMSIQDAKTVANSTIPMFNDSELTYYTLQVYVKKNNAQLNNFPIVGYKGVESKELVFTKDREITKDEENKNEE